MNLNRKILKKFVVIEGLDGSGTTTQLSLLKTRLKTNNIPSYLTFEPTDNIIGSLIRKVLAKEHVIHPESLARLFVSDRTEHLIGDGGIQNHLDAGEIVISDRYIFSSHAYQSLHCDFNHIVDLNSRFPLPELLVFLDLAPDLGQARLNSRGEEELFDNFQAQQKVRELYLRSIGLYSGSDMKIEIIDGSESIESISENIWEKLKQQSII